MHRSILTALFGLSLASGDAPAWTLPAQANPTDPMVAPLPDARPPEPGDQNDSAMSSFGPLLPPVGRLDAPDPVASDEPEFLDLDGELAEASPVFTGPILIDEHASAEPPDDEAVADEPDATTGSTDARPLGMPREQTLFSADSASGEPDAPDGWFARTALALGAVIGLILVTRWVLQWVETRTLGVPVGAGSKARAPSGLIEVLARYPVSRGTKLLLLKINSRVLLVSQTSSGLSTLSEIADPDEVASILIKSRDDDGESAVARFTEVLREMENDPSVAGERIDVRSPRRALSDELADGDAPGDGVSSLDGASALRNRLSRLGDLSA